MASNNAGFGASLLATMYAAIQYDFGFWVCAGICVGVFFLVDGLVLAVSRD